MASARPRYRGPNMGTDEVFAVVKETRAFDRARLRKLILDLWIARGAELTGQKWAADAVWKHDNQDQFGYAIGPASPRGWITIVESVGHSVSLDGDLLDRIAAATTAWVCWSCDH